MIWRRAGVVLAAWVGIIVAACGRDILAPDGSQSARQVSRANVMTVARPYSFPLEGRYAYVCGTVSYLGPNKRHQSKRFMLAGHGRPAFDRADASEPVERFRYIRWESTTGHRVFEVDCVLPKNAAAKAFALATLRELGPTRFGQPGTSGTSGALRGETGGSHPDCSGWYDEVTCEGGITCQQVSGPQGNRPPPTGRALFGTTGGDVPVDAIESVWSCSNGCEYHQWVWEVPPPEGSPPETIPGIGQFSEWDCSNEIGECNPYDGDCCSPTEDPEVWEPSLDCSNCHPEDQGCCNNGIYWDWGDCPDDPDPPGGCTEDCGEGTLTVTLSASASDIAVGETVTFIGGVTNGDGLARTWTWEVDATATDTGTVVACSDGDDCEVGIHGSGTMTFTVGSGDAAVSASIHVNAAFQCGGSIMDSRDTIIVEYRTHNITPRPTECNDLANSGGSANFTWSELNDGWSDASRHPPWAWTTLNATAQKLEALRTAYGDRPIRVSGGYRCPHGNALLGGSQTGVAANSKHMQGRAADIFGYAAWASGTWTQAAHNELRELALELGAVEATLWERYPNDRHLHVAW